MYPTWAQINSQYLALLDDPLAQVFKTPVFQAAFNEAYDVMYAAFLQFQCPRIELEKSIPVPPMTQSLTPAQMGISDFGDYVFLTERRYGALGERWSDLLAVDRLRDVGQMQGSDRIREFDFRNNTFYFSPCSTMVELKIRYDTSGVAPTDPTTVILVDSCTTFLANYSVGASGSRKGRDQAAKECMAKAVGPNYVSGSTPGGALFRLISPLVRSRQHVQIAHKPYSASRRVATPWAIPYVAAQQGTTGGGAMNVPIDFTTADGSIIGPVDGINTVFWLNIGGVTSMEVFRNGIKQTYGVDFTWVNNQINFLPSSTPQIDDIITASATTSGEAVAYAPPDRSMSNSQSFGSFVLQDLTTVTVGVIPVPYAVPGQTATWAVVPTLPYGMDVIATVSSPGQVTVQLRNSGASNPPVTIPPSTYFVRVD